MQSSVRTEVLCRFSRRIRKRDRFAGNERHPIRRYRSVAPAIVVGRDERVDVVPVVREQRHRVSGHRCAHRSCPGQVPSRSVVVAQYIHRVLGSDGQAAWGIRRRRAVAGRAEVDDASVHQLQRPAEVRGWIFPGLLRNVIVLLWSAASTQPGPQLRRGRQQKLRHKLHRAVHSQCAVTFEVLSSVERAVRTCVGARRIDDVVEPERSYFDAGYGIDRIAAAIREVDGVPSVKVCAGAAHSDGSLEPSVQVCHVEFDVVHDPFGSEAGRIEFGTLNTFSRVVHHVWPVVISVLVCDTSGR